MATEEPSASAPRRVPVDWSRYLPPAGVLVVLLGVPLSCVPTRSLVLCDDALGFQRYESLESAMWTSVTAAAGLSLVALTSLLLRRRRTWVVIVRVAALLTVVGLVVLQDRAGEEAARVASSMSRSQTCVEPLNHLETPHGLF